MCRKCQTDLEARNFWLSNWEIYYPKKRSATHVQYIQSRVYTRVWCNRSSDGGSSTRLLVVLLLVPLDISTVLRSTNYYYYFRRTDDSRIGSLNSYFVMSVGMEVQRPPKFLFLRNLSM